MSADVLSRFRIDERRVYVAGMSGGRTTVANVPPAKKKSSTLQPAHRPDLSTGRLLLLDGHSLAYRAFYALPAENFRTQTGHVFS